VHAPGEVPVLRGDAVAAWRCVAAQAAPSPPASLQARLVAAGLAPDRAEQSLAALVDAGLLG